MEDLERRNSCIVVSSTELSIDSDEISKNVNHPHLLEVKRDPSESNCHQTIDVMNYSIQDGIGDQYRDSAKHLSDESSLSPVCELESKPVSEALIDPTVASKEHVQKIYNQWALMLCESSGLTTDNTSEGITSHVGPIPSCEANVNVMMCKEEQAQLYDESSLNAVDELESKPVSEALIDPTVASKEHVQNIYNQWAHMLCDSTGSAVGSSSDMNESMVVPLTEGTSSSQHDVLSLRSLVVGLSVADESDPNLDDIIQLPRIVESEDVNANFYGLNGLGVDDHHSDCTQVNELMPPTSSHDLIDNGPCGPTGLSPDAKQSRHGTTLGFNPGDSLRRERTQRAKGRRESSALIGDFFDGFAGLGLGDIDRRNSTGSIFPEKQRVDHRHLNPMLAALIEPLLAIDEGSMEWRNLILHDLREKQRRVEALALDHVACYVHPLHDAEDPHEQRRRLYPPSDDDVSVITSDSVSSNWSIVATCRSLLGLRSGFNRSSTRRIRRRSGRRFIDLTINCYSADNMSECDSEDGELDSLDMNDTSTMFSIPVEKKSNDDEMERSEARQFLDLTNVVEVEPNQDLRGGQSTLSLFSWMGRQGSVSAINVVDSNDDSAPRISPGDSCDDAESTSSDDEDLNALTPWEAADAAFIESVHEIASDLERRLNAKGFESPYWTAQEIIPSFEGLHEKIKHSIEGKQKGKIETFESVCESTESSLNQDAIALVGRMVPRVSLRLAAKKTDTSSFRMIPRQDDSLGGYDDLGMRTLHRDGDAYLKNFLYDFRTDGFCSLPLVLANGLEKPLDPGAIDVAVNILQSLTSPLRRRNQGTMPIVLEEGNDDGDDGDEEEGVGDNYKMLDKSDWSSHDSFKLSDEGLSECKRKSTVFRLVV